jgi:hypothetical protein
MNNKPTSQRAFESDFGQPEPWQRPEHPVLGEVLTPTVPPEGPVGAQAAASRRGAAADDIVDVNLDQFPNCDDPSKWSCYTDSVRAQLESVAYGLPPPPPVSTSRFRKLNFAAPAKTVESPSALAPAFGSAPQVGTAADSGTGYEAPATSARNLVAVTRQVSPSNQAAAIADSAAARGAVQAECAGRAARPVAANQAQQSSRLDDERARQIEELTRRAEAAETKVRALEMHIAAEQQCASALGRRFGQKPHELFPAFVARLGMTAKAEVPRRGQPE